ncbi:hypothetical protein [Ilumatobacter nonamiensis]|uniref:hypothetical protein n=1 Tax=Ilumatobacter nonamiensis TaxID=467093 RepID=UPI000344A0C1|nr:hypothetical protein [Ilumatobacter nonamiensis]
MQFETKASRSRESVGPPGGPTVTVPSSFTIKVTDLEPYDLRFETKWDERERRLTIREATFLTAGDEPVRMAGIIRVAIGDLVDQAMEAEVLGERGWPGVVEDHPDEEQERVDALVYLLSVALGSPKPSANVAIARGLSPASGPKRVGAARKAGLLPATESGRPSAGLSSFDKAARAKRKR